MALIERYYSCELVPAELPGLGVVMTPAIALEPTCARGYDQREFGGDVSYLVVATDDEWAGFDVLYPSQDAQTGSPYRRRYPRTALLDVMWGDVT